MNAPISPPSAAGLGILIQKVSRLFPRRFEQPARAAALPLTRNQCSVLAAVGRDEGVTQAALAQYLDLEPITLVRLIDGLEAAGLLERRGNPRDRRVRILYLTEAALPLLERVHAVRRALREDAQAGLPAEPREQLVADLHLLGVNLLGMMALGDGGQTATPAAPARQRAL
jgi:MarR family transcriptional regulator, transcriptional regulator for hemolysin